MAKKIETNPMTKQRRKKGNALSGKHDVQREGWSAEDISAEASYDDANDTKRQLIRGKERNPDAKKADIVGGVDFMETPKGREENSVLRKNAGKTKTRKNA